MTQAYDVVSKKSSTAYLVLKPKEGPFVKPTSKDQAVELQGDFSITTNTEVRENLALRNSITPGKPTIAKRTASVGMSHYFVGSGEQGKVPQWGGMLEASFGGLRKVRDGDSDPDSVAITVTGSDRKNLVLAANHGFKKGDALFIRLGTDVYVRTAHYVEGNKVELSFALPNGVTFTGGTVGKCVTYNPINYNIPVFDIYQYMGSRSQGMQAAGNCRTTSVALNVTAADNVNCSYSFEGGETLLNERLPNPDPAADHTGKYDDPFWVTKGLNDYIEVALDTGDNRVAPTKKTITITGDDGTVKKYESNATSTGGTKLAAALQTALSNVTVAYDDDTGKFSFTSTGKRVRFVKEGSSDLYYALGFYEAEAISDANGVALVSSAKAGGSYPTPYLSDALAPTYQDVTPVVAKDLRLWIGDPDDHLTIHTPDCTITVTTERTELPTISNESTIYAALFSSRNCVLTLRAYLYNNDRRFFERFKKGSTIRWGFVGGQKTGGNWEPGTVYAWYSALSTITNHSIEDVDEAAFIANMEITTYAIGTEEGSMFVSFA